MHKYLIPILLLITLTGCTASEGASELVLTESAMENASSDPVDQSEYESDMGSAVIEASEPEDIIVYVCGAVNDPGVYTLSSNSRADDAVTTAGGFSEEADINYVNLAAPISDGSKLFIPTKEEVQSSGGSIKEPSIGEGGQDDLYPNSSSNDGLININTASKEELKTLPGVGDVTADKIIDYRQKNGEFKSIEDIKKVSGIKDKLFSKIKEKITTS
ncbi:MAG: helix-hairpin-helix domain-containing protein [Butyrivibrio sp.]|nr:helix-hairpin-helix domain-containing protein [Butyrivibrio sp.]